MNTEHLERSVLYSHKALLRCFVVARASALANTIWQRLWVCSPPVTNT